MNDFLQQLFLQKDIEDFITNRSEESPYLEFKAAPSLADKEESKKELAKDVSAFANSDGGLLIYGIMEKDHRADSVDFIDGRKFTKEWIEQVITSRIQKQIEGLKIDPIRFGDDLEKSVYVVKIPRSHRSPHMTSEGKYYRRRNFKAEKMEEYEVREFYNRVVKTELDICDPIIKGDVFSEVGGKKITKYIANLEFNIKNTGSAIEERYKLEVHIPRLVAIQGGGHTPLFAAKLVRHDEQTGYSIYSFPNESPLFQDELATVTKSDLVLTEHNVEEIFMKPILLKLYYASGTKFKEIQLKGKLLHKDHELTIDCFKGNGRY